MISLLSRVVFNALDAVVKSEALVANPRGYLRCGIRVRVAAPGRDHLDVRLLAAEHGQLPSRLCDRPEGRHHQCRWGFGQQAIHLEMPFPPGKEDYHIRLHGRGCTQTPLGQRPGATRSRWQLQRPVFNTRPTRPNRSGGLSDAGVPSSTVASKAQEIVQQAGTTPAPRYGLKLYSADKMTVLPATDRNVDAPDSRDPDHRLAGSNQLADTRSLRPLAFGQPSCAGMPWSRTSPRCTFTDGWGGFYDNRSNAR